MAEDDIRQVINDEFATDPHHPLGNAFWETGKSLKAHDWFVSLESPHSLHISLQQQFTSATRTVDCIVSTGAPVARVYGVEILTISRDAVNIDRVTSRMCPLLDSHRTDHISQALGMVTQAWVERGALMATLAFNQTPEGDAALGMVSRGEIAGISAGYRVREWMCTDEDGMIIDQEATRWREGLTFTAVEWELLEISICAVPADSSAGIRDFSDHLSDIRARMAARQAMSDRMSDMSGSARYLQ